MINFTSGAKLGDFIHSLYAVKNICIQKNDKANLYLDYNGDIWTYGIEKAYKELYPIVSQQPYINSFEIIPDNFNEEYINLNSWRQVVATTHAETGRYNKCWSELLSQEYNFNIPNDYQWLNPTAIDENTYGKTIIHRSKRHHTKGEIFWSTITNQDNILFVTTDESEWDDFKFKGNAHPYILSNITDWINAIASCKLFIGNQSAGLAIASALDKNRLAELYPDVAIFYSDEVKYSKNINWVL